ncbi:MAG: hypothetical protein ABSF54_20905 [Bryobacteraceae bacterium]|jgi:hypothetical protein
MPLGDAWSGVCRAGSTGEWQPDLHTLQQLCNFGYAREKCTRVPAAGPDAVRFSISHDRDGLVGIYWVTEKDHLPFAHGPLDYSRPEARFRTPHPDACIAQQAQVYVTGYLRRKGRSGS